MVDYDSDCILFDLFDTKNETYKSNKNLLIKDIDNRKV